MRPRLYTALLAGLAAVAACTGSRPSGGDGNEPAAHLHALFDREWEWELSQDPLNASYLGDTRWNDRWPDLGLDAIQARQAHREGVLRELAGIRRADLPPADQTNYDIFEYQYEQTVEGLQHRYHLIRTATYDGVQTTEQVVDSLPFASSKDYDDWLARLDAFPAYIDQNIGLMREGIRVDVVLPKVIGTRVAERVRELATQPVESSGFYRPFANFPASIAAADRDRLKQAGAERIRSRVQPAFARLGEFMNAEYLPASYDRVGWWQTSSGDAGYRYLVRLHTTTDLDPQRIHQMGLDEVARVRGEMERIKSEVGFRGSLPEFFTHLRTAPRFFYKTSAELLEGYRAVAKRIDPELVKISRRLPRISYGVLPIPAAVAPITTTAYANFGTPDGSRPPYMFVNLYRPETRPKWEMIALTLHEAMPGHCLQGSIAQEQGDMPAFRRNAGFTAYTEGWGLYAESLGEEMGVYRDDPYAKFGQLTYQMWRAVRLVVDTGMHAMQWDRDRAIKYFMDNAAKTELDVTNEVDRYIGWPGQALAYKVGEMKIQELRRKAQSALGDKFDVRDYNDVVLQTGAVPLNILEQRIDRWIAER
jgi:uncharacterized protein (DUF885 family)